MDPQLARPAFTARPAEGTSDSSSSTLLQTWAEVFFARHEETEGLNLFCVPKLRARKDDCIQPVIRCLFTSELRNGRFPWQEKEGGPQGTMAEQTTAVASERENPPERGVGISGPEDAHTQVCKHFQMPGREDLWQLVPPARGLVEGRTE